MPMCDMYIPSGSFAPEVERELVASVSERIVANELRRTAELLGEDENAFSRGRTDAMAWMYVLRPETTYVSGRPADVPHYKFVMTVPAGMVDARFTTSVIRDIHDAVRQAEGDKPDLLERLRVFINETKDGHWGAGDRSTGMAETVEAIREHRDANT